MVNIHKIEANWILALQGNGSLRREMIWLSYFGYEALPYILPFVYVLVSRRAGARLYVLFAISEFCIHVLKLAFQMPRPFQVDPHIRALCDWGGYGLPSGHVLATTALWGSLAVAVKTRWVWFGASVMVLLVSVSRVYLGVHFISDVVSAWIFAVFLIWWFSAMERMMSERLKSLCTLKLLGFAASAASLYLVVGVLAESEMSDRMFSSVFSRPTDDVHWVFKCGGGLFGALCGIIMVWRLVNFDQGLVLWKCALVLCYTLAGLWLVRDTFGVGSESQNRVIQVSIDFLKNAFINWWILFLAPWLVVQIGPEVCELLRSKVGRE